MSQLVFKPRLQVTVFHIKAIAALLMLADHIGLVIEVEWLRIVGRFSFPLFAWLLVQGANHTKNWQCYEGRLLMLAIASQPLYALLIECLLPLNGVFQLWVGLVLLRLIREHQMTVLLGVAIVGVATIFFDYQYYGIGLIYLVSNYPRLLPVSFKSIHSKVNGLMWVLAFVLLHFYYTAKYPLQLFALPFISLMPFLNTVSQQGSKSRWFYWFYPLHFVPLILLKVF